jgi:hypothetical protein
LECEFTEEELSAFMELSDGLNNEGLTQKFNCESNYQDDGGQICQSIRPKETEGNSHEEDWDAWADICGELDERVIDGESAI